MALAPPTRMLLAFLVDKKDLEVRLQQVVSTLDLAQLHLAQLDLSHHLSNLDLAQLDVSHLDLADLAHQGLAHIANLDVVLQVVQAEDDQDLAGDAFLV